MKNNLQLLEYKAEPGSKPRQTTHHIAIADEHKTASVIKRHATLSQEWRGWVEVQLKLHQSNAPTRIFSLDRDREVMSVATTLEDIQVLIGHMIKVYIEDFREGAVGLIHIAQACDLPPEMFEQLEVIGSRGIEREREQMRDAVLEVRAEATEKIKELEEDYESASNERAQLRRERHELVDKIDRQQAKIDDLRQQLNLMRKSYQQELNLRTNAESQLKAESLLVQVSRKVIINPLSDAEKVAKLKELLGE